MILVAVLVLAACSGNVREQDAFAYKKLEELARKNGCSACHSLDTEVVGPAWRDVARRYKGVTSYEYAYSKYSMEDGLVKKASLGGRHDWGEPIMKQNDPESLFQHGKRQKDIRKMVRIILELPLEESPPTESSPAR